jgi:hypothetical protein
MVTCSECTTLLQHAHSGPGQLQVRQTGYDRLDQDIHSILFHSWTNFDMTVSEFLKAAASGLRRTRSVNEPFESLNRNQERRLRTQVIRVPSYRTSVYICLSGTLSLSRLTVF